MPTPVGPVPPDPDDPDLWQEWYDDESIEEDDVVITPRGWAVRVIALLVAVAFALLLIFSR